MPRSSADVAHVTQALQKWNLSVPVYIRKSKTADVFDVSTKTIDRWRDDLTPGFDFPMQRDFNGITRWLFPELLIWGERHAKLPMAPQEILRALGLI